MISFGAKLNINNNIYRNLSQDEKKNIENVVSKYKEFIEHKNVDRFTKDDEIELRRSTIRGEFGLELEIKNDKFEKPFVTGVYTGKRHIKIEPFDLIFQTLLYMCYKTGEKPGFFESSHRYIDRVLFNKKLLAKKQDNRL